MGIAGVRTNHKKGIAAKRREEKRFEAEHRNARYQGMTLDQKMERNSAKVLRKLAAVNS